MCWAEWCFKLFMAPQYLVLLIVSQIMVGSLEVFNIIFFRSFCFNGIFFRMLLLHEGLDVQVILTTLGVDTIKGCCFYSLLGGLQYCFVGCALDFDLDLVLRSRGWCSTCVTVWMVLLLGYAFSSKGGETRRWMGDLYPISANVISGSILIVLSNKLDVGWLY